MKQLLLLVLTVLSALGASAQIKIGRVTQPFKLTEKCYEYVYTVEKGKYVGYTDKYIYDWGCKEESYFLQYGPFSNSFIKSHVQFSGYYYAEVKDPVDNYVNVRKGPGTNYSVVTKLRCGQLIIIKRTDSNWLKVYGEFFTDANGVNAGVLVNNKLSANVFIGYIYKDRVKTPSADQ